MSTFTGLWVIAIDPGLATGAAVGYFPTKFGNPTLLATAELEVDDVVPWIREQHRLYPDALLACETFTITAATAKKSQATWSLEHIGAIKQHLRDIDGHLGRLHMQSPGDAKRIFPNAALKSLGLWHVGGEGHAIDAIRHMCLTALDQAWVQAGVLDDDD
jgi:hypothetical protein